MSSNILIVKTSALGDIIQSLPVLEALHARFPHAHIDWAVEQSLHSIVSAHPLIHRAIPLDTKGPWRALLNQIRTLRSEHYDLLFDLQGNCKSALVTALARAKTKVGFGLQSAREWPNILATNTRFNIPKELNIRLQYLELPRRYFRQPLPLPASSVRFNIDPDQQALVRALLSSAATKMRIMVCPGSKWINKQLHTATLIPFLQKIEQRFNALFYLMWGSEAEKKQCEEIQRSVNAIVVERLSIPTWQNLMSEMHLVIAVDSSALHLCGTTRVPSFSLFGPTSQAVFKPLGDQHYALQGPCPYGRTFPKQCPLLRTCTTGACLRQLKEEDIYDQFVNWWEKK